MPTRLRPGSPLVVAFAVGAASGVTAADTLSDVAADADEEPIAIEEVVVEPEGEPEATAPLGLGVGGETLRTAPGSAGDPLRSLQSLPGFAFADDQSALPAVRGSRPGDNLFEADFVPIGYLFHAGGVVSVFNAELVESFEIYPSAHGPEFAGVTGGVFDVRLRDPARDRFRATLDVNVLQAGALVEGPIGEDRAFYLAGRFSYLDLLVADQLEEEDGVTFTQFPKYTDYQAKYVWDASERSTWRLQANGASDEQDLVVAADSSEIELEPIFAGRSRDEARFDEQALVWELGGGRTRLTSALGHSRSRSESLAGGAGRFDVESESWLLKSHATVGLGEAHDLGAGFTLARSTNDFSVAFNDPACTEFEPDCRVTGSERLTTDETLDVVSGRAHVKDTWYVNDALTLFPGLAFQADDYLDGVFVEPRFALEYALSDDTLLSAGAGVYHQAPGVLETNAVFGNPALDYIESLQAVIGVRRRLANGVELKGELFYKTLDDLVSGDETRRYSNDGEGQAYGLDVLARTAVGSRLSGWASFSLSESTRRDRRGGESFPFAYDQPYSLTLAGRYALSPRWTIGAKLWVHAGGPYTSIVGAEPNEAIDGLFDPTFGTLNGARYPDYRRLDLRVERAFRSAKGTELDAYLEILNVLDADNVAYYDYNADFTRRETVTQLPRIAGIGLRARF